MNQLFDVPSDAEHLAAVIAGSGSIKFMGALRPVLARVPETQLAEIDAMAKLSAKSRSGMVVHLLEIGIKEVYAHLDDATKEKLYDVRRDVLVGFQANTAERETGEL